MADPLQGLSTFLAVERAGTITSACEVLHLSQPAVTRRLQALEQQVGGPLFERTSRGLVLTSIGSTLLPFARRACAAERDGLAAVADQLSRPGGVVTVGVVGSLAGRWAGSMLATVVAQYPDIEIALSTGSSAEIRDKVCNGDLTIGVSYSRARHRELEMRTLFQEELFLCAHPTHPCADVELSSLADLCDERWLVYPSNRDDPESTGSIIRNLLQTSGIKSERLFTIDSLTAQIALIQANYGIAFLPSEVALQHQRENHLTMLLAAPIHAPVTLLTRRNAYLGPAEQSLVTFLDTAQSITTQAPPQGISTSLPDLATSGPLAGKSSTESPWD